MKSSKTIALASFMLCLILFSSCAAIGDIFQAGMGFGIIVVIAAAVFIVFIFMKVRKSK